MDTLYTFGDHNTQNKTESVHFWGLMNSASKIRFWAHYTVIIIRNPQNSIGPGPQISFRKGFGLGVLNLSEREDKSLLYRFDKYTATVCFIKLYAFYTDWSIKSCTRVLKGVIDRG